MGEEINEGCRILSGKPANLLNITKSIHLLILTKIGVIIYKKNINDEDIIVEISRAAILYKLKQ